MSVINNGLLLASAPAASAGYIIQRSLRFNAPDGAFLSRTPGSAGNRKTWTWAGWVKRSALSGSDQFLFLCSTSNTSPTTSWLSFNSSEKLSFGISGSGRLITTQVFRDVSAWYHIVLAVDTTQATASNRYKLYVNGSQITAFDTADYVAQNTDTQINAANEHRIGRDFGSFTSYLNGYLADIHFCDGTAYDALAFGEFDANGIWQPKAFSGTYGTNGFRLTFSDNSGTTATTLGKDAAGSNNWSPNNFSVATGAGNDSLVDVPTSSGTDNANGGEIRGNYCTWNPLDKGSPSPSNGNLDVTGTNSHQMIRGTVGVSSGKWYWEVAVNTIGTEMIIGIANPDIATNTYVGKSASSWGYWSANGYKMNNDSPGGYGATYTTGDVIGVAFDADNGTLTFYKNGSSQGQAYSGLTSGPYLPAISQYAASGSNSTSTNWGQRAWAYTAPSGFKALNTASLAAPLVTKPSTVFDTVLYTGNGSTQTISGLGFSPDLVWVKKRSSASSSHHILCDTVRGENVLLSSSETFGESNYDATWRGNWGTINTFTSTGFNAVAGSQANGNINSSSQAYVAWTWDAGSTTVTNTAGSITSSVRANATAGFSIVSYTGNGTVGATVGHSLGVVPGLVIIKNRDSSQNWPVKMASVMTGGQRLQLNTTDGFQNEGAGTGSLWNATNPSSTVITLGDQAMTNTNNEKYVAYCFAPVAGYSSFGSYTGNGSTDGPFVYTGMRVRYLLVKRTDATASWEVYDAARNPSNLVTQLLEPNTSGSEFTGTTNYVVDFLSNGFKIRGNFADLNANNGTFVYAAFAESPFQYARAR